MSHGRSLSEAALVMKVEEQNKAGTGELRIEIYRDSRLGPESV